MYPIYIDNMRDYEAIKKIGFEPLIDWRRFYIYPVLRHKIQHYLFGFPVHENNIPKANEKFYRYAYDNSLFYFCEECGLPLPEYSAKWISHILTKGGHTEFAHDLRNFNILCLKCHNKWEFSTDRKKMKIYRKNQIIINQLIEERNGRFRYIGGVSK